MNAAMHDAKGRKILSSLDSRSIESLRHLLINDNQIYDVASTLFDEQCEALWAGQLTPESNFTSSDLIVMLWGPGGPSFGIQFPAMVLVASYGGMERGASPGDGADEEELLSLRDDDDIGD